ncbi:MAG TPA: wax ester/triacylglycerol synthase domain-containing protein [Acidimicrobiales bacterium]|nr:wax ester/triacylglycerol synthase domain-containing protein [Acidimicrobiales bacterium]
MPPADGVDPRFDERMTDLEALMWGLERADPSLQTVMVMAGVLDRPVDPAVMIERLEATCRSVPRLTELPQPGPLPMVPPRWVGDPGFDVANHLRSDSVAGGADFGALSRVVERSMSEPFEAGRPPWDFTLVDGLEGGRGGFVARLHHSYTDGQGAVQIALGLFDSPEGAAPPTDAQVTAPATTPAGIAVESLVSDVVHEVAAGLSAVRKLAPWAAGALRDAFDNPADAAARTAELATSLARTARAAMLPGSPVLSRRSGETRVAAVRLNLDELRAAGKNCGGTVNDVFLAGILGGLSMYHEKVGAPFPAVKLGIPVSTRGGGDSLHNQLQGMLLRAPLNLRDPKERIRLIHAMVAETRQQPWLPLIDVAAAAAVRLPFAPNALAGMVRYTEVLASNLPGPPERLYLAGAGVDVLVPFGPRAGSALNLTLLSYAGGVAIGVNADAAALSDHDLFVGCLSEGFDEVLA